MEVTKSCAYINKTLEFGPLNLTWSMDDNDGDGRGDCALMQYDEAKVHMFVSEWNSPYWIGFNNWISLVGPLAMSK